MQKQLIVSFSVFQLFFNVHNNYGKLLLSLFEGGGRHCLMKSNEYSLVMRNKIPPIQFKPLTEHSSHVMKFPFAKLFLTTRKFRLVARRQYTEICNRFWISK